MAGVGTGEGPSYTAGRVTTTFDLSVGVENRSDPYFYSLYGISLRYRLF